MVFVKSWTFCIGVLLSVIVKGVIIDYRQASYYWVDFQSFTSNCLIFNQKHEIEERLQKVCNFHW